MENLEEYIKLHKNQFDYTGAQNPQIKYATNLLNNTRSNPDKLVPIEGIFQHVLALKNNIEFAFTFACIEDITSNESFNIIKTLVEKNVKIYVVSKTVFSKVAEVENMGGLFSFCKLPIYKPNDLKFDKITTIVILDGVEIPGNIGTILRACDASGTSAVFVCNRKARLTHPKLVRASLGSIFNVPIIEWESTADCLEFLKSKNFKIYLADTRACKHYFENEYNERVAFVMGSERYGITKEWYDYPHELVSIPMNGKCDSLNVATATTILLFEASIKQHGFTRK